MSLKKTKSPRPRFSVVIPAYNEENYIADSIQSLRGQSYGGDIEIIVVDNASTDRTAEIALKHGAIVINEDNPGVCWARQAGTEKATGEIVISTDADTVFNPTWIDNIDKIFLRDSSLVAVAGPCQYIDPPLWGKVYPILLFGFVRLIYRLFGFTVYITATNIAFKKSHWRSYDTNLTQGGDELDLLRNLRHEGRVCFDLSNPSYTSSRRLTRGLVYNLFFSFILYYAVEYALSRVFKHPIFGAAHKFRDDRRSSMVPLRVITAVLLVGIVVLFSSHMATATINTKSTLLKKYIHTNSSTYR